ncbi:MAG: immunoglobulin domain-containing protein [Verrucomicrobiales bacterium]|nr:immunoglobulin domain-containing protein [Verrucomicrobiales bacterium]
MRGVAGALALVALAFTGHAQALNPCQSGQTDDIEIEVQRQGFYRQTASGVTPDGQASENYETAAGPFAVEVVEDGDSGFQFPDVTFEGTVSFLWGKVAVDEPAVNWTGHREWFETEAQMSASAGAGAVSFRFEDTEVGFSASLNAAAWSMPTPEFSAPKPGQVLDPAKPVTFQWAQLSRNAATDVTLFQIRASDDGSPLGNVVFTTIPCSVPLPFPWIVTMAPNATSITVPAGIFTNRQARYTANLSATRYHGSRQGSALGTWSMDLTDRKLTAMPLTILGGAPGLTPPRIVVQPHPQSVNDGATIKFSVSAEGSEPLSYQWQKDGQDLLFANGSELVIPSASAADQGIYRVIVKNAVASVISEPVQLKVEPGAPVTAKLRLESQPAGKWLLTAEPAATGLLVLQTSSDLVTWTSWKTQQVTVGVPYSTALPAEEAGRARWFLRSGTSQSGQ